MKEILGEKCYTAQEVADMLGVTKQTVFERNKNGSLKGTYIGRRLYVTETEIRAFLRGGNGYRIQQPNRRKKAAADSQAQTTETKKPG